MLESRRMARPGLWLAAALALAVVGLVALGPELRALLARPEPDTCRAALVVLAADGRALDVETRRCEYPHGRHPALLLRAGGAAAGQRWMRALEGWCAGGRGVWHLQSSSPAGREAADLALVAGALAEESWVDAGRVGVLLSGAGAGALLDGSGDETGPPWDSAAAWLVHDPPSGLAPAPAGPPLKILEGGAIEEAGPDADAWFRERLHVTAEERRPGP